MKYLLLLESPPIFQVFPMHSHIHFFWCILHSTTHTHTYNRRDGLMYKVIRVCDNSVLRSIEYLSPPISKLVTTLCVFLTWCSWYFWEIFLPDDFLVSVFYDRHCRQYSHLFVLARHGRSKTYFWLLPSVSIIICDWLSLQAHMFF